MGNPAGDITAPFNKKGLLELIDRENLAIPFMRKDIPDSAGLGGPDNPTKYFYKLKLREISPGTVPPGFVEIRGPREVVYDRMLSKKEIQDFELEPLGYEESK